MGYQKISISAFSSRTLMRRWLLVRNSTQRPDVVESSWNVMAHGDAREGKWRGNWRMDWVASKLHTTSEHVVSSITTITTADVHSSAASSRLNWRPRRFKWTRPFRRKTKSDFCACAITFQTQSVLSNVVTFSPSRQLWNLTLQCVTASFFHVPSNSLTYAAG
jgi:hypothetical protein